MKRLYRRLTFTFLLAEVLFLLLFAAGLYARAREENGRYLDQLLENVEYNIQQASAEYEEQIRYLKEEYITRAQTAAYILAESSREDVPAAMEALREIMDVGEISLIDDTGKIILSTDSSLQGSMEEQGLMEDLRSAADAEKTAVRFDPPEFSTEPGYLCTAAAARPEWFGEKTDRQQTGEYTGSQWFEAVRIDADMEKLGLISGKEMVGTILRQATTEERTGIFAVSKASGKIFGITENNSQEIRLGDMEEGGDLTVFLADLPEEKTVILPVNGEYKAAVLRSMDDMYLAAYTGLNRMAGDMMLSFWIGLAVISMVSILTVLTVRRHLQKYMFRYFDRIREEIYGVLSGEGRTLGESEGIPELKPLFETIVRLEEEYTEKSRGMNHMEDQLTRARTEAEYDLLTGLYNRMGFERRAQLFLDRENQGGMLILFDLDNFKRINDSEGHPAGDRALQMFAECLMRVFRREDVTGRIGGDEFAVFITNPVPREILEEKFRSILAEVRKDMKEYYEKYSVSVSIGAVSVEESCGNYDKLYRCADTALYIAKYLGKNQFYINDKKIDCMRRECIHCRADCPRSRIISDDSSAVDGRKGGNTDTG